MKIACELLFILAESLQILSIVYLFCEMQQHFLFKCFHDSVIERNSQAVVLLDSILLEDILKGTELNDEEYI